MRLTGNLHGVGQDLSHDPEFRIGYKLHGDVSAGEKLDLFLHGFIGDPDQNTDSLPISQVLKQHPKSSVTMYVNSGGGLAFDGIAIYNALKAHSALGNRTTSVIEGLAGSAASLATLGCQERLSYSSGVFAPHYSIIIVSGHSSSIREGLLMQEQLDITLEQIYSEASGRTLLDVRQDLSGPNGDGRRFSAAEALECNYIDRIIDAPKRPAVAAETAPRADLDKLRELRRRVATVGVSGL